MTTNSLIKGLMKDTKFADIIALAGIVTPLILYYITPAPKENPNTIIIIAIIIHSINYHHVVILTGFVTFNNLSDAFLQPVSMTET